MLLYLHLLKVIDSNTATGIQNKDHICLRLTASADVRLGYALILGEAEELTLGALRLWNEKLLIKGKLVNM